MKYRAIPYEGSDPYIFINYCHKDKASLYPVFEQMARDGYRIWYDDGNKVGDDWLDNIENHLEECRVVVAFISGNSSMSHSCKSEIVYAFKCRKKILPILIDRSELPKGLRMQLSHLHYLKASDYNTLPALLDNVYADDQCKACYTEDGNLLLQEESPVVLEDPVGFWDELKPVRVSVRRKKTVPVLKDISVEEAPSPVQNESSEKGPKRDNLVHNSRKKGDVLSKQKNVVRIHAHVKRQEQPLSNENPILTPNKSHDLDTNPEIIPHSAADETENMEIISNTVPVQEFESTPLVHTPEKQDSDTTSSQNNDSTLPASIFETAKVYSNTYNLEETVYQKSPDHENVSTENEEDSVTVRMDSRNLAVLLHPAAQRSYILRKPQTKIGRSPIKCDIVIEGNDSISKYHADIIQYQKKTYLRDMNSANGTYINGNEIEGGSQILLSNPAVFQISDETLVLLTGALARQYINMKRISFLLNEEGTSVYIMDLDDIPLNRNNPWPDGTLSDTMIHRAAHAVIRLENDGYHLINEAPANGNGTYLNEKRLKFQESRIMVPGDRIRLGETTLEYVSITI